MAGRLEGKRALVTGGTHGIGEAIVRAFVSEGAQVLTVARGAERGEAIERELAPAATFRRLDVTDEHAWRSLVADHLAEGYDVLVNNAGGLRHPRPLVELEPAEWRHEIELNLTAPFLAMRYVIPGMLARGRGSVINIGSMSGLRAQPDATAYQAAKAGLRLLTRNAALTYAARGVRVNAINPGFIVTRPADMPLSSRERWFHDRIPMAHRGDPMDIAWAAVYLASDESRYVTGIDLQVDGGYEI
jgi:NAD(P)-dependent dehydrogenase (short-subunit alcohol dehydrogenase family)